MRRASIFALFIALVSAAFAQTTTVTGTVTDPDSTNWALGTITFNLIGSGGPPYYCNNVIMPLSQTTVTLNLDSSGAFSGSLCSNSSVTPTSTQWQIRVCSATNAPCQNLLSPTTVSGASQSLTTFVNNQLSAIRIQGSTFNTRAYTDTEIVSPVLGFTYFNITSGVPRFWNGSVWATVGTGSGAGVISWKTRTGAVVPVSGDYTAAQITNALDLSTTTDQTMSSNLIITTGKGLNTGTIRDVAGNIAATLASGVFTFPNAVVLTSGGTSNGDFKINSSFALWAAVIRDTAGASVMTTASGQATFPNATKFTSGLTIGTGQKMTAPPEMLGYTGGNLALATLNNLSGAPMTMIAPITITRLDWQLGSTETGCTTNPVITIMVGGVASAFTAAMNLTGFFGHQDGTLNVPAGSNVQLKVTTAMAGCTPSTATSQFQIHYVMQ